MGWGTLPHHIEPVPARGRPARDARRCRPLRAHRTARPRRRHGSRVPGVRMTITMLRHNKIDLALHRLGATAIGTALLLLHGLGEASPDAGRRTGRRLAGPGRRPRLHWPRAIDGPARWRVHRRDLAGRRRCRPRRAGHGDRGRPGPRGLRGTDAGRRPPAGGARGGAVRRPGSGRRRHRADLAELRRRWPPQPAPARPVRAVRAVARPASARLRDVVRAHGRRVVRSRRADRGRRGRAATVAGRGRRRARGGHLLGRPKPWRCTRQTTV